MSNFQAVAQQIEKIDADVTKFTNSTKQNVNQHDKSIREHEARLLELEQSGNAPIRASSSGRSRLSFSKTFRDSSEIQNYIAGRTKSAGVTVKTNQLLPVITANTIVTDPSTSQTQLMPGVVGNPDAPVGLRQLFVDIPATGGSFTYLQEDAYTNNAEAQAGDAAEKAESGLTFVEKIQAVSTYAQWLKISKQVLADAPATVDFTGNRLLNGLESKIENAIINGDGTSNKLSGLLDTGNFTVFTPGASTDGIQNLRAAKTVLKNADFTCNLIILNPTDAEALDLIQDSTGQYVYGDPHGADGTAIWGVPIFVSRYLAAGTFIALDRLQAATVHTREDATISLSDSDDDNFTKNLSTMLTEARLGFAVHHPLGIVSGLLVGA